jgi:cobalt-zinc-cadmium efflux system outer membrane protein
LLSPIRGAALTCGLGLWPALAWASPLAADDVVRHALEHHPDAVAARGALDVASALRRDTVVFIDNPQADLGLAVVGDLVQGALSQPLSLTGEGWYARSAARSAQTAAEAANRRSTFVLAAAARAAYVRARAADERASLADQALADASMLRVALEDRGRAGEIAPLDVRLARLAEARTTAAALAARRDATFARAALAAFHPDAGTAELVDPIDVEAPAVSLSHERSDVQELQARVDASTASLNRARAAAFPPVAVGAMFQRDAGEWDAGPQLAVEIPLWSHNRSEIAAAHAELATAEAEAARRQAVVAGEVAGAAALTRFADDAVARLGDVDADAREALVSVERGLNAGDLTVAEAVLLRAEILDGWTASVDVREAKSLARLDAMLTIESEHLLAPTHEEGK